MSDLSPGMKWAAGSNIVAVTAGIGMIVGMIFGFWLSDVGTRELQKRMGAQEVLRDINAHTDLLFLCEKLLIEEENPHATQRRVCGEIMGRLAEAGAY